MSGTDETASLAMHSQSSGFRPRPLFRPGRVAAGAAVALLAACTATPHDEAPRTRLDGYELRALAPEIRAHANCLAREMASADGAAVPSSMTLRMRCAATLAPLQAGLQAHRLSLAAQQNTLGAIEIAARASTGTPERGAGLLPVSQRPLAGHQ